MGEDFEKPEQLTIVRVKTAGCILSRLPQRMPARPELRLGKLPIRVDRIVRAAGKIPQDCLRCFGQRLHWYPREWSSPEVPTGSSMAPSDWFARYGRQFRPLRGRTPRGDRQHCGLLPRCLLPRHRSFYVSRPVSSGADLRLLKDVIVLPQDKDTKAKLGITRYGGSPENLPSDGSQPLHSP